MGERLRVAVVTPLSAELSALVERLEPRVEMVFEPELLPPERYPADHHGDPAFTRTPAQERRFAELVARADAAVLAGVDPARIVLDPGIGFAKTAGHNWALLRRLDVLVALGFPILLGVSRKRFLGKLLASDAPVEDRDLPTAVLSALAADAGVWGVRVHDVPSTRLALDVWEQWDRGAHR